MQLSELQRIHPHKRSSRVGRGGKRGKTSGRGQKGQKARAGHRLRPELRDTIKRLPKLRGHGKNRARTVNASRVRPVIVSLSALDQSFQAGDTVSPQTLAEHKLIKRREGKGPASVKILANGSLSKKLTIAGCVVSKAAQEHIEKAGGKVA